MAKINIGDLPIELLLDDILPFLPVADLLRLTCCSKLFSVLCSDDTLWKHKLSEDYNFSGEGTARTSGWKFIYRGLFKPRGEDKGNGRLGLPVSSRSQGLPYPTQLSLRGARIVSLVAGGMSFHALDSEGKLHVWGTLNGTWGPYTADSQGFASPAKQAKVPHCLKLPSAVRSVSCGRLHSSCLDSKNKIWTFTAWGRPFYLTSPILADPEYMPKQIECGWTFSSMLTKSGDVFVWWPFNGAMGEAVERKMQDMDSQDDMRAYATDELEIPCIAWGMDIMPARLPPIPALPELTSTGKIQESKPVALIQIAAFDNHIVGLTNYGHVLKYGALHDQTGPPHGRWEYLPQFSEQEKILQHPVFSDPNNGDKLKPPGRIQITHLSANFDHFIAYSTGDSSVVLLGNTETTPDSPAKIIPELQNRSIISVVIGDYHNAALTVNGKLLTWGQYSNGALGLGDPLSLEPGTPGGFATPRDRAIAEQNRRAEPPAVSVPTEVRFDHKSKKPRERFCVSVTAAGWHTGALVIDLDVSFNEDEDDEEEVGEAPPPRLNSDPSSSPVIPLPGIFRIGHAGRGGMGRGIGGGIWRGRRNAGGDTS
ncbi:RCC1/BLIP-II [Agrocybe pediades]|nr:RCC1/BLIP-II [Agrocybe pediades]